MANQGIKSTGKGSSTVAGDDTKGRKQPSRKLTRFTGVYSRDVLNRRTGKTDTAFDITYRDATGKKVWVRIGYASEGVNASFCNRKRGHILEELANGKTTTAVVAQPQVKTMTFAEAWDIFAEKWLPTLAQPEDELLRYKSYLHDALGHKMLDKIGLMDIEDLQASMMQKGYAAATIKLAIGDIKRIYRKITAWGLYSGPIPTDNFKMPKLDNARTRYLTEHEVLTLLEALKRRSQTWHDIAALSLYTGMRKGEILSLRGEHLDFAGRRILVKDAKTGSRVVIMTDEVFELLERCKPATLTRYVFYAKGSAGTRPIKTDADESFRRSVKECGFNNGITDSRHRVVFHTLRHTYCSWLAMSGVPLFTISELVGHSSVEMTKRYSHLCPDARHEAAARIGSILQSARK